MEMSERLAPSLGKGQMSLNEVIHPLDASAKSKKSIQKKEIALASENRRHEKN
jgi:hypothetical protein